MSRRRVLDIAHLADKGTLHLEDDQLIHLLFCFPFPIRFSSYKMDVSNKERKEHKRHKKSKKNREHKEHKDKKRKHEDDVEMNAGSFKKALVTPTTETTAVPPTSSHPVSVGPGGPGALEELGLFAAGHSSADEESSSDEDEATARSKALQKARTVNDATMAAVADLLTATTGSASGTGTGGVSADVIKMQQQLQQQIPFAASTTTTASSAEQLTREEILESIAGIPAMQMLLQQDELATAAAVVQQPHQDANAILLSLSNDPSILATVNNPDHQPTLGQIMQREAAAQQAANEAAAAASGLPVLDGKSSSSKKKKAAAAAGIKKNTRQGVPATAAANNRTLEEQMEYDMSGSSDSLLHTKWMMATELKERGKQHATITVVVPLNKVELSIELLMLIISDHCCVYQALHTAQERSVRRRTSLFARASTNTFLATTWPRIPSMSGSKSLLVADLESWSVTNLSLFGSKLVRNLTFCIN